MLSEELLTAPAEAVVIPMGDVRAFAVEAATVLRGAGIKTQIYFEDKKFKQKITYADKSGIPFAVIVGEDEAAQGVVAVKDMHSGEQRSLTPPEAAAYMNEQLALRRSCTVIRD